MIRLAFRLHRWGMLGFGLTMFLSTFLQGVAFQRVAGDTPASRQAFAQSMTALGTQLSYLLPPPRHLEMLAGYVQWRAYGALSLVAAAWLVVAAARTVRGDEEKGLVEAWLAAGVSRTRLLASRIAGFGLAALVAAALGGLGALIGGLGFEPLSPARVAGQTLALWLMMITGFALCALAAQVLGSARGAQLGGAALLLVLYLCDAAARSQPALNALSWISPFKWYDATNVLVPGGRLSLPGIALSIAVSLAAFALATLAFRHRDIGAPLLPRRQRETSARGRSPSPLLGWPVVRLLYQDRLLLLAWLAGSGLLALFMVGIARSAVDSLISTPLIRDYLARGGIDPYQAYVSIFWFGVAQLLLAGFAIHLVSGWASEDSGGMLEALLSRPRTRWGVVVERAAMALFAAALVIAIDSLLVFVIAAGIGIDLNPANTFRASWLLIPFCLTFAALGALGSAWRPRVTVGVLGILALLSYFISELTPLMGWPDWVANLSVFQLYGNPLGQGIYWAGLWAMLAIVLAGFGLAALLMQRRDVGS